MNYIILNNYIFFKDKIHLENCKEAENERDRCDIVFAEITLPLLADWDSDPRDGTGFFQNKWLLGDGGASIILCKIDKRILHSEDEQLVEKLFGVFNKERFFIEIRGYHDPQSYNQIEQYIFCYNKSFGYMEDVLPEKIEETDRSIFEVLLENIEKKIIKG